MMSPTSGAQTQRYSATSYSYDIRTWTQAEKQALAATVAIGAIVALGATIATLTFQFGGFPIGTIGQYCLYGTIGLGGVILLVDLAVWTALKVKYNQKESRFKALCNQKTEIDIRRINLDPQRYTVQNYPGECAILYTADENRNLNCYCFENFEAEGLTSKIRELFEANYRMMQTPSVSTIRRNFHPAMASYIREFNLNEVLQDGEFCGIFIRNLREGRPFYALFKKSDGEITALHADTRQQFDRLKEAAREEGFRERGDYSHYSIKQRTRKQIQRLMQYTTMLADFYQIAFNINIERLESHHYCVVRILDTQSHFILYYNKYGAKIQYQVFDHEDNLTARLSSLEEGFEEATELSRTIYDGELRNRAQEYMNELREHLNRNRCCMVSIRESDNMVSRTLGYIANDNGTLNYYTAPDFTERSQHHQYRLRTRYNQDYVLDHGTNLRVS